MNNLEDQRKEEVQKKLELANVVNESMTMSDDDVCSVIVYDKVFDVWILDSGCSFYMFWRGCISTPIVHMMLVSLYR